MENEEPRAFSGFGLRSTRRGSLVVQTEAARRMMGRLREIKETVTEPAEEDPAGETAPAGP